MYFDCGLSAAQIFKLLKLLGIKQDFVYRTVRQLRDTGNIQDCPRSGHPRTVWTKDCIKQIHEKIQRNHQRSARKLAAEENVNRESMRQLLKYNLGFRAYRKSKLHGLMDNQKDARVKRCRFLLK